MSISDVMKYVRETPGNTNPAVIKSMVEAEQRDFQVPALQKILEEAKAYSDLKGGYTKTEMQTIFSGQLSGQNVEGFYLIDCELSGDVEYTVIYNEKEYICKSISENFEGMPIIMLGNASLLGNPIDTEEPWCMFYANGYGCGVKCNDDASSRFLSISTEAEVHVPIESKFLPEGGFGWKEGSKVVLEEIEIEVPVTNDYMAEMPFVQFNLDSQYTVTLDGVSYLCSPSLYMGYVILGNPNSLEKLPFFILPVEGVCRVFFPVRDSSYGKHTISIVEENKIHSINPEFLPKDGVGYTKKTTITYDGVVGDREFKEFGNALAVRIYEVIEPETIIEGAMFISEMGEMVFLKDTLIIRELTPNIIGVSSENEDNIGCLVVKGENSMGLNPGTYAIQSDNMYLSRIVLGEPQIIKAKYLQGEIDLLKYGIDLQELTRYQGGNNIISNTKTLWEEINRGENATFSCRVNDTIMKLTPTSTIYDQNGLIFEIGINFTYLQNTDDIVNAFLILSRQSEDSTFFGWYVNTYAEK